MAPENTGSSMGMEQLILQQLTKLNFSVGELSSSVKQNGEAAAKLFEKVDHLEAHGCVTGTHNAQAILVNDDRIKSLEKSDNHSHGKAAIVGGSSVAGLLTLIGGIVKGISIWKAHSGG